MDRDTSEPIRFEVRRGLAVDGQGTVAAGVLTQGTVRVGDELEWVRHLASRRVTVTGLAELRTDPPQDPPLEGLVLAGIDPSDLAEGDLLRTPIGEPPTVAADGRTPLRMSVAAPGASVYDRVGGRAYFNRLVERFYEGVAADPLLRPMYPDDLTESIAHTAGFLAQYWGGGTAHYSDERGHPRLRMRHGHVAIGVAERDRWVHHMTESVRAEPIAADIEAQLLAYFEAGATAMINADTTP